MASWRTQSTSQVRLTCYCQREANNVNRSSECASLTYLPSSGLWTSPCCHPRSSHCPTVPTESECLSLMPSFSCWLQLLASVSSGRAGQGPQSNRVPPPTQGSGLHPQRLALTLPAPHCGHLESESVDGNWRPYGRVNQRLKILLCVYLSLCHAAFQRNKMCDKNESNANLLLIYILSCKWIQLS